VTGAAPDGTSRVLVEAIDGRSFTAAIGDGAWSLDLAEGVEPKTAVVVASGWRSTIALASPR
jgi:hypothetical protein